MLLNRPAITAELSQYGNTVTVILRQNHGSDRIIMHVVHIAYASIRPSGHSVYQTCIVVLNHFIHDFHRIVLSPSFIEYNPSSDTGIETETINHLEHFFLPLPGMLFRSIPISSSQRIDMFLLLP